MSSFQVTSAALFRQPLGQSQDRKLSVEPVACGAENSRSDWALLGESVAVRRLRSQIGRVAPYFRTALIRGEAGSGKEFVARAIHELSPAGEGPFIVADVRLLVESEDRVAAELFELAHGGTLYLTPVGELSFSHQAALLRFFQASELRRVDSPRTRILAASDGDLRTLAASGQFSRDLYARLSTVQIFVPPLRQRVDDIPILGTWLLRRLAEEIGQSPKMFAESAILRLQEHPWPNNLREFERVVAQAAALADAELIEARHLRALFEPEVVESPGIATSKSERLHDVMQRHVLDVLTRCGGNKVRAAELLGISRSTLYRMLDVSRLREIC